MIGAAIAIVIVVIAAVIAVRSAREGFEATARPVDRAALDPILDTQPVERADEVTEAGSDSEVFDPEATQTMEPLVQAAPDVLPPSPPAVPAPPIPAPAITGPLVVREDLGLDEVLSVAEEAAEPPRHPTAKLAVGITAAGLVFAAALLVALRGIGSFFGNFLK